jgi:hypothetical protein
MKRALPLSIGLLWRRLRRYWAEIVAASGPTHCIHSLNEEERRAGADPESEAHRESPR